MVHHDHHSDGGDSQSGGSDRDQADAPEPGGIRARGIDGIVDTGWLRPHTYRRLGHPRVSTVVLLVLWIALLVLYLQVHVG
ncbi:hypothetical protein [Nocardia macrotermitis]|uniref:Uncharacterized protein n=1 Tax=Nocardia macrotermitis TaxID=2585198 RepID=A0A7K0DAQ8_9NOCA|nr:hypothetical protein [Nocardia macrotermitis]MQY22807.1 hypothetical protein [Nocardia macrotermitis]